MRSLLAAGLYVLVLLPGLLAPVGKVHARSYLMEFTAASGRQLLGDVTVNLAFFLPLGWMLHRAGRQWALQSRAITLVVLLVVGVFSFAIESLQYFLPTRYSSILDVAMNTLGAVIGALAEARRHLLYNCVKFLARAVSSVGRAPDF